MANREHVAILERGADAWNNWRESSPDRATSPTVDLFDAETPQRGRWAPDLSGANLSGAKLRGAQLSLADLSRADLTDVDLRRSDLRRANLARAELSGADLWGAHLQKADLRDADLRNARCHRAILTRADLRSAKLHGADFFLATLNGVNGEGTDLTGVGLAKADLQEVRFKEAILGKANLFMATLRGADLRGADLKHADLRQTSLVEADFREADLRYSHVYGASAWDTQVDGATKQEDLIISPAIEGNDNAYVTVDDLSIAQFVYLLLSRPKIGEVIQTIGERGVLILGRFGERKHVLDSIRDALRDNGYLPIVFDFERPTQRDFSETVLVLAGLSRFIIADITRPRSVPLELELTVPNYMIPFVPIIQKPDKPFSMFEDLWRKHRDWVLDPLYYESTADLLPVFKKAILEEANKRWIQLRKRKGEELQTRDTTDYQSDSN